MEKSEIIESINELSKQLETHVSEYAKRLDAYIHCVEGELDGKCKRLAVLQEELESLEIMGQKLKKHAEIEAFELEIKEVEQKIDKLQAKKRKREEQKGNFLFDLEQDKKEL